MITIFNQKSMKKLAIVIVLLGFVVSPIEAKKVVYPNGNVYKGKWKHGAPNGKGTMTYKSGAIYTGNWIDGKKYGQGILTRRTKDGHVYEYNGTWKNDSLQTGSLRTDDYTYKGTFKYVDGHVRFDVGRLDYANGNYNDGTWSDSGEIVNGKVHLKYQESGSGQINLFDMEYRNGEMYEGVVHLDTSSAICSYGEYHKGKFTGFNKIVSPSIGNCKIVYKNSDITRIEFGKNCFIEGEIKASDDKDGYNLINGTIMYDQDGVYKNGKVKDGLFSGEMRTVASKPGFTGTVESGQYVKGKYVCGNDSTGYFSGDWKDGGLYNGFVSFKAGNYYSNGKYINGKFRGNISTNHIKIGQYDYYNLTGSVLGDTVTGKMSYAGEDIDGTVVNGKIVGWCLHNDLDSVYWRNDSVLVLKTTLDIQDRSEQWHINAKYSSGVFNTTITNENLSYKTQVDYNRPFYIKKTIREFLASKYDEIDRKKQEIEERKREKERLEEAKRRAEEKKEMARKWERVGTIRVAIASYFVAGERRFHWINADLYHRRGSSSQLLYNYSVGENKTIIIDNPKYGEPVNETVLGDPGWANSFRYYVPGIGYTDL